MYDTARELGFKFPDTLEEWASGQWREFAMRRNPSVPWLDRDVERMVRDFERTLNAYYPTTTDIKLGGLRRQFSRALAAWRYQLEFYKYPFELRAWQKLVRYQRPETTGF
jgi:hypothetical protein